MPSRALLLPDTDAKPSRFRHKSLKSLVGDVREIEETEDPGKRSLHWLNSVFPLLSLIQIDSAYQESGGDAYKADDILGAELVDPEESPLSSESNMDMGGGGGGGGGSQGMFKVSCCFFIAAIFNFDHVWLFVYASEGNLEPYDLINGRNIWHNQSSYLA
ncbi:hypothetical protein KSP40_PGU014216 [Platanthera guangdongensis]|uniref:At5g58720/SDE5-like UBA-like domain-containing protein n=1 Tax=Platanthera guangdongensis TaxID=2320717 RepID=A0ABR2MIE9_9ASPA